MELRQLEHFVAVAEERSFARAQASDPGRIARLLWRFHDDHPGVIVRVIQGSAMNLLDGVGAGEIDLALCGKPLDVKAPITLITLVRAPFVLACGPKHPLAVKDRVTLEELVDEQFIDMNAGWASRQLTDRAFGQAGIKRDIVCELDDVLLLIQMVEEGLGVAIIPGLSTRISAELKSVPIHPPLPQWHFVAAFVGSQPANVTARVFLGMVTREWSPR